jgi:predicted nucleic acid-binding protein
MSVVKVYLDNCCFNRPYDDQSQLRVELETKAKLRIQRLVIEKKLTLVSSVILRFENNDNPYLVRKNAIKDFLQNAAEYVDESEEVKRVAHEIMAKRIKPKDATHLACAIFAKCDFFITTDGRVLKHQDERIRIINPVDFIMTQGGSLYE